MLFAATMSIVTAATAGLTCNLHNCPGGDIAWANPLPGFQGGLLNCSATCNSTKGCVGWVYQGPDAAPLPPPGKAAGACGSSYDARCYLKARKLPGCKPLKCTCTGTNGRVAAGAASGSGPVAGAGAANG